MSEEAVFVLVGLTLTAGGLFAVYLLVRHWRIIRDPGSFEAQACESRVGSRPEEHPFTRPDLRLIVSPWPRVSRITAKDYDASDELTLRSSSE
jgi:hypothetical protein